MTEDNTNTFPISRIQVKRGNRRLAREKVLQILFAYSMSGTEVNILYENIYNRDFNFGDSEAPITKDKILKPDEVHEIDADIPIEWSGSDLIFLKKLLEKTLLSAEDIDTRMREKANNWELDRITLIDRLLIQMSCAELMHFEDIPPKVTINESIDIAKKYSTDKSGHFINGILDSMFNALKSQGLVVKKGRGLIDK